MTLRVTRTHIQKSVPYFEYRTIEVLDIKCVLRHVTRAQLNNFLHVLSKTVKHALLAPHIVATICTRTQDRSPHSMSYNRWQKLLHYN